MTEPFQDREIAGTEPLYYNYRKEDGYITRYCAMLGMNDPLCLFLGNYDRIPNAIYCFASNKVMNRDVLILKESDRRMKNNGFKL
ncbi:MAG: hypothetical protein Q7J35_14640 [Candidatus Methanoperedens sp.]|nr:hypothetical protein [Candidatus Methanoperedens sp.]